MKNPGWFSISDSAREDIVLAVDMDGTTRSEATFHDLAPMLDDSFAVNLAVMPDLAAGASVDDLMGFWLDEADRWACEVKGVFGYCSGALFALLLADRVEAVTRGRLEVVLFDPERPTSVTFHRDFTLALDGMSALDSIEHDDFRRRAHRLLREHESTLEGCVQGLSEVYAEACGTNLSRLGITSDIADDLTDAFRTYGSYILCASRIEPDEFGRGHVTALVSADHKADGFDCKRVRLDTDKRDLLRSRDAATHARSLVRGGEI